MANEKEFLDKMFSKKLDVDRNLKERQLEAVLRESPLLSSLWKTAQEKNWSEERFLKEALTILVKAYFQQKKREDPAIKSESITPPFTGRGLSGR